MNCWSSIHRHDPISSAILETVVSTDTVLSPAERGAIEQLMNGIAPLAPASGSAAPEKLLVTQKKAADMLSVNRVTVWRMTRDSVLHQWRFFPARGDTPYRDLPRLRARAFEASPEPDRPK